jgi:hypothetical protein
MKPDESYGISTIDAAEVLKYAKANSKEYDERDKWL